MARHTTHPDDSWKAALPAITEGGSIPTYDARAYPERRKRAHRRGVWTVLFWVALAVFVVALGAVILLLHQYAQGEAEYTDLADAVLEVPDEDAALTLDDLQVDWDALRQTNDDVVAWMYMPGTVINYPVASSGDNSWYLTHTFDGTTNNAVNYGCLFLQGNNATDFTDANNIIYGHAMKNGTMFGALYRMSWNGTFLSNPDIYLLTPQGNLHLRTFAYTHVPAEDLAIMQTTFTTDEERTAFIQDKMNASLFAPEGSVPSAADMTTIFSFVTCDSASSVGRYIVYAYVFESTIDGIDGLGKTDPNAQGSITQDDLDGLGQAA